MNKKFIVIIIAAVIVLCGSVFAVVKFGKADHKPQDDNAKTENSSVSSTASDNSSENASSQNVLSTDTDSNPSNAQDKTTSKTESEKLPTSSKTESTDSKDDGAMTYKEYIALTPAEQQAYFETFDSIDAYFVWYNAAKKEYEDSLNAIDIDGEVNIGDLIEENNGK